MAQDAGLHRRVYLDLDDRRLDDDHGAGLVRATGKGPFEARAGGTLKRCDQSDRLWGSRTLLCALTWADSVGEG